MDEDAVRLLEFGKVLEILAGYTVTPRGRRRALALRPMSEPGEALHALGETTEMVRAHGGGYRLPLSPVEDMSASAEKAQAGGGPLETQVLWRVAECLDVAARVGNSLRRLGGSFPALTSLGRAVPQCPELAARIRAAVDAAGMVRDEASPELKAIRQRVRTLRKRIEETLRRLVEHPDVKPHLQYPNPTMCRDRYVLPVNAYRKHEVVGFVHGTSDSGATLYIEPMQIVDAGNELAAALGEEEEEVRRVLWQLTRAVGAECETIKGAVARLAEVDVVRAKAMMADAFQMCEPALTASGPLSVEQARHPLLLRLTCPEDKAAVEREDLDFDAVVPLDIHLGRDFRVLILTGPNTGGKTVVLKAVGLLCLMAQAGMHVPAARAAVPMYQAVFVDIGDEQSLEQSLSTFSSHVSRIIRILRHATTQSLVLLDELGAGTDPAEGGALGEAVLNRLVRMGCPAIVVTHLGRLKTYAVARPQVESASMEFDVRTLRPTYRLTIGTIGSSNALEIAERLGMPPAILADARALLDVESAGEYTPMLEQVRLARQEAEERRERMQFLEREADRLKGEYEETLARLKAEEARTEAGIGLQMREILERLHKEADRLHEDLRHGHKTVARRVREVRDGLSECLEKVNALLKGHRLERALKPGDEVYVVKLHRWGNVERVDRRANRAKVRVGETQIDVELADLQPWGEGL